MSHPLLRVRDLTVHFPLRAALGRTSAVVHAVDGVDLTIERGTTLGLVGESGCGKSTTGLALLRLVVPTAGAVEFDGTDVTRLGRRGLRRLRRRMTMIFQDPHASLDPRHRVGAIIAEPLVVHRLHRGRGARRARVRELLELVGLPGDMAARYPHELSGGQRQRVGIARALATSPDLVVCDEPTAALDVSIRSQILNLLTDLQDELGVGYLFISHDLAAVEQVSHRIAVMYLGRVVEEGGRAEVVGAPRHPYTRALLSAVPVPDPGARWHRQVLRGEVPSPTAPPSGCRFRTRCPEVFEPCPTVDPALHDGDPGGDAAPGHLVACHLHGVVGTPVDPPR